MANSTALPVRIGLLYDYPQMGDIFSKSLQLGIDEVAASGRLDREVELVERSSRGLPSGSEAEVVRAFDELDDEDVVAIVGPSISDNALIAAPLCDAARIPAINYSGGERTRSEWMFHYQVGSLEEEPPVLAARMVARGLRRAAVIFDQSPVGRRYAECFEAARARLGLEVTGTASISALAEDATELLDRLRQAKPDVLVYLGLGVSSRAVSLALDSLGWDVPVLANSALMFGYARPDWRDGYAGWEYIDTIADDNLLRARLGEKFPHAAGGPIGCAAYDIGRLLGEGIAASEHLTRAGIADGLRRVKQLPASSGYEGTLIGFGVWDHAALKGHYLVLRTWRDGHSVQV
ncbi:MAG TPA: ABC transporter substrate-binding protein [Acidimicrobiia bacterium]|jgi:ABC-type branched-subunit amino acid transport system substrate-binding protein|nr:ABC transporter substrate-binding protein [Acidimicrobiia bacterium]